MNKLNGKITASATMRGALTRGAGGGTYVEANPEGEATDTLEKLTVEDTIYNVRNVPDASSAHNGDVLTKTSNGAQWEPLPETGVIYSTVEQEIGTWIDGRILYQKTIIKNIDITEPIINNYLYLGSVDLTNDINADIAWLESGFYLASGNERGIYFSQYESETKNLTIFSGYIRNNVVAYLTLRYVKQS